MVKGFPAGLLVGESACTGGPDQSLGWEDCWRGAHNPLQYFCLRTLWTEEPVPVHGVAESRITYRASLTPSYFHFQEIVKGRNHDSCVELSVPGTAGAQ